MRHDPPASGRFIAPCVLTLTLVGCASDDTSTSGADAGDGSAQSSGDSGPGTSASTASTSGSATSQGPSSGPTGPQGTSSSDDSDDTGPPGETPDDYCGAVLFAETFEDANFEARGWYDAPSAVLSTDEAIDGSQSSFECRLAPGAIGCEGGTPSRVLFEGQSAFCLSYWVKYSDNYVGSGQPYHPHEFLVVTNEDDIYVGPAYTRLTAYVEHVAGTPLLALQDSRNVDPNCVLLNNDSIVGCNGDFDSYPFTEARSATACNGLLGELDGRDCYSTGTGYYSLRSWHAQTQAFGEAPPYDKTQWHRVVGHFRLNDIEDGIGVPNGVIRYWVDGELLIGSDDILMRTGAYPNMLFDQLIIGVYIGDGSPVDQTMWVDDLEISGAPG